MGNDWEKKAVEDMFRKQQDEVNRLVARVLELAEKTSGQIAISNDRIGKLNTALSKVAGKSIFEWIMLCVQILFLLVVLFALFKGYTIHYKDVDIVAPKGQSTETDKLTTDQSSEKVNKAEAGPRNISGSN